MSSSQWIRPDWPVPPTVRALITTRAGGSSAGPYSAPTGGGMNLGLGSGDDAAVVLGNRARLREWLPAEPRWLRQVHGARVVDAAAVDGTVEADAAVTDHSGTVAAVMVADCMPVLFSDERGRCVGVAHAGWRGLAAGILQATARAMRAQLGDPCARLFAYLGPAIGPDHFEVGSDVLEAMTPGLAGAEAAFVPTGPGKYHADLFALGRMALAEEHIDTVFGGGVCTYCDTTRFYSHRRDRITGRHAAMIWIERDRAG
jgi:YfiH family protein